MLEYQLLPRSDMLRFVLLILLISGSGLVSSQKIILTVNASSFIEGTAAKLKCAFPPSVKDPLQWDNVDKVLPEKLRCVNDVCNEIPGYKLSSKGNNITLIIEQVNKTAPKWECSTITSTLSEITILNIKANPPLKLTITKEKLHYNIKTSCSALPLKVECKLDSEPLELQKHQSEPCSNPVMSYIRGMVVPDHTDTIICTVRRNDETYMKAYHMTIVELYYVGGAFVAVGLIMIILSIYKKHKHICCFGITIILYGLGLLIYNHVFGVFIAFMVLGSLVALLAILHKIYEMVKGDGYKARPDIL